MQTVVETNAYLAAAKAAGMSEQARLEAVDLVAADSQSGDVVQGTGGCRKVRLAGRGKGEKDNLSKAERNELAKLTKVLFENYGRTMK